jgi:hypothetical protein
MRIRNVVLEFEARLEPLPAGICPKARGKAEWKVYDDGTRRCKASLTGLGLPDGTVLELAVHGRRIALLSAHQGTARYRRETERGESVPVVELNEVVQVFASGQLIMEGRFYEE